MRDPSNFALSRSPRPRPRSPPLRLFEAPTLAVPPCTGPAPAGTAPPGPSRPNLPRRHTGRPQFRPPVVVLLRGTMGPEHFDQSRPVLGRRVGGLVGRRERGISGGRASLTVGPRWARSASRAASAGSGRARRCRSGSSQVARVLELIGPARGAHADLGFVAMAPRGAQEPAEPGRGRGAAALHQCQGLLRASRPGPHTLELKAAGGHANSSVEPLGGHSKFEIAKKRPLTVKLASFAGKTPSSRFEHHSCGVPSRRVGAMRANHNQPWCTHKQSIRNAR